MIIGNIPRVHPLQPFLEGLASAARGVLRVRVAAGQKTEGFFTGWLVTDSLAVSVPNNVSAATDLQFYACTSDDSSEQELHRVAGNDIPRLGNDDLSLSILRLERPLPGRAIRLGTRDGLVGESAAVLQFVGGAPQLSFSVGRITAVQGPLQHYDASTEPGSTGGPVIEFGTWEVVGMHRMARPDLQLNQGLTLTTILDTLRASPVWGEIADFQQLANVAAASLTPAPTVLPHEALPVLEGVMPVQPSSPSLLSAAVLWSFDPQTLRNRDLLRPLVISTSLPRWTLKPAERVRLIQEAGSLEKLRHARGRTTTESCESEVTETPVDSLEQQVIDRILKGPPFKLDEVEESALPYWLQAVRWFSGVVPDLPSPADVLRTLESKRLRSRLHKMTGPDFQGRTAELEKLSSWQQHPEAGPMVITGIGGVGKSALVAQFALQQPKGAVVLWLDFDRPDLAPDDAVSVLQLVSDQLSQQLPDAPRPEITSATWEAAAGELAVALAPLPEVLVILDGFEVAQHVRQHQEIWNVLQQFTTLAPALRIVISGRAPVRGLQALGARVDDIHLTGLPDQEAAAWLKKHGITGRDVITRTVKLCKGIPLMLRTVLYLLEKDGATALDKILAGRDDELVQGFLYDRILDRVIDPLLKPVAQDALVLRRITEAMLSEILADRIPDGLTASEVVQRLQQELALVGDHGEGAQLTVADEPGTLRLRPEVRSATIHLLEAAQPVRVRDIDNRAATWYAKQDLESPANAAELVYHRLRLGDIQSAEAVWSPALIPFLQHDEPDLPEKEHHARTWLRQKLVIHDGSAEELALWEQEAHSRIQQSIMRGLNRVVPEILKEKPVRSADSPLVFYDAWTLWKEKDYAGALDVLHRPASLNPGVEKNRGIMQALALRDSGNLVQARRCLSSLLEKLGSGLHSGDPALFLNGVGSWMVPGGMSLETLALHAAMVRLLVDLEAESVLARRLGEGREAGKDSAATPSFSEALTRSDAVLPTLALQLKTQQANLEAINAQEIPQHAGEMQSFFHTIESSRWSTLSYFQISGNDGLVDDEPASLQTENSAWQRLDSWHIARHIAVLATQRWRLASRSLFLHEACKLAPGAAGSDALVLAITSSLVPFRGQDLTSMGRGMDSILDDALKQTSGLPLRKSTKFSLQLLKSLLGSHRWLGNSLVQGSVRLVSEMIKSNTASLEGLRKIRDTDSRMFLLYLLAPDPLETLCSQIASPPAPNLPLP